MKALRFALIVLIFLVAGCTNMYSHAFRVEPVEPLSQEELHNVFANFKLYLSNKGMREVTQPENKNPDYVAFELGSGKSGLLREPFEEYLELSYTPEKGFIMTITRVISHPVDFSDQYISDFKLKTEEFIHEATSKNVRLQVINGHP